MKKNVMATTFVIILMGIVCVFYHSFTVIHKSMAVSLSLKSYPVIVIDPGHGGFDGGAVGKGNVIEKDINLSIALKLQSMLELSGFTVVMTRETDTSTCDEEIVGTKKRKTSDMHNRLKLLEKQENPLFISIHQNKFQESKYRGAQVFYSPNNPESADFANVIQANFRELIQPENKREQKKAGKELFLLYRSHCPSVLIECGFLSNPEELLLLTEEEYQDKIAFTVYKSILDFISVT